MVEYSTGNLVTAACLWLHGERLVRVDTEGRLCLFVFEQTDNLQSVVGEVRDKQMKVEPTAFAGALREIKAQMYKALGPDGKQEQNVPSNPK